LCVFLNDSAQSKSPDLIRWITFFIQSSTLIIVSANKTKRPDRQIEIYGDYIQD
jgi:hypothetical protein